MAISKVTKIIDMEIHSAGSINYRGDVSRHDGYGFDIEEIEPRFQRQLKSTILVTEDGRVLITRDIVIAVSDPVYWDPQFKIGGRGYLQVDYEFLIEATQHNTYPARNDREAEVRQRNQAIITYLEGLL